MNTAFGNNEGSLENLKAIEVPAWQRLEKQCTNIGHEFDELVQALAQKDSTEVRDALCDILVFTLGAFHFMGVDADADMRAVFDSNMSKFCSNEQELKDTCGKYADLGIIFYTAGEFPCKYLKSSQDQEDNTGERYPKGKFLKGINFKKPIFA